MKYLQLCCLTAFLGCISCSDPQPVVLEEATADMELLPDSSLGKYNHLQSFPARDGSTRFALFDRDRANEIFFDAAGKELRRVRIFPDTAFSVDSRFYIQALNEDSMVAVFPETRELFLLDRNGALLQKYTATVSLTDGQTDYLLVAMVQSPVLLANDRLLAACTRMDVVVRTPEARKKYFSTPPYVSISLRDTSKQANVGYWPANYRSGTSYRDFYPQHCVNSKGQVVIGFSACDSLFVLENGKLIAAQVCKSAHMGERHPFPDDSLGHFAYLARFDVNEPRYGPLVYDPYRHYYYRIVHHAQEYEKPGGMTVNGFLDKPWSLMVLDEEFHLIGETMFDQNRFLPGVFPAKDGLLVCRRQENNGAGPVKLTLFKFKMKYK